MTQTVHICICPVFVYIIFPEWYMMSTRLDLHRVLISHHSFRVTVSTPDPRSFLLKIQGRQHVNHSKHHKNKLDHYTDRHVSPPRNRDPCLGTLILQQPLRVSGHQPHPSSTDGWQSTTSRPIIDVIDGVDGFLTLEGDQRFLW